MTAITLNKLSFYYSKKDYLIKNLNLSIPHGFILLTGPTGSGKSTLLKIMANLYPKYGGILSGKVTTNLSCAMMFQNPSEQFTMETPREEIIFTLENLRISKSEYKVRLKKAINFAQIDKLLDQNITTLSGGEKQRVALAILVAMDIELFLLDEPFASCDPNARKFLINKLDQLVKQHKTIIISDHVFTGYKNLITTAYRLENKTVTLLSNSEKESLFKKDKPRQVKFNLPNKNEQNIFNLKDTTVKENRLLLNQAVLTLYAGKSTLITGNNGSGKTSFFRALSKMISYNGHLFFNNREIAKLKPRTYLLQVAQIFQSADDQFLRVTVRDELELSKKRRNQLFSDRRIDKVLKKLSLDKHLDQVVYSLSGGQKKKLQILLALIEQHDVLLIDEPLSGLDHESVKQVIDLMIESQKSLHQSFFIISHQVGALAKLCDYHLVLEQKKLKYITA